MIDWTVRRDAHQARVDDAVGAHRDRARSGRPHPVEDFLFRYYTLSAGDLRRWHPGFGVTLTGPEAAAYLGWAGYVAREDGVTLDPERLQRRLGLVASTRRLLAATASRAPQLGCLGLHEWAMVYRDPAAARHVDWPLRLGPAATDAVVEGHRIACTHFDAYRFFTPGARPLNQLRPGPDDRPAFEQPGCLHAGMDLYKHAGRLQALVGSDLVLECFLLARDIRVLDMRASPYDLRALGYEPVPIETPVGKQTYIAEQRTFAERAAPLRARLIQTCEVLESVTL